ncbi:hypothetical protein AwDysgo_10960 [Bacteroidales bacterium]|nr:hypothetical protein AwDysgo_10960 [Bacteroidales bacterium]
MLSLAIALSSFGIFLSCSDDKLSDSILVKPVEDNSATGIYIKKNFTEPFQMVVGYKWNFSEADMSKELVPPREEFVVPVLDIITQCWISPYQVADASSKGKFNFKYYIPKQLQLIGSPAVNTDGTITLGTAEGGKKIVLYWINEFDKSDPDKMNWYFHVMHHEFAHILHQNKEIPIGFQNISKGKYLSAWQTVSTKTANEKGFITPYSMSDYHEDFVEIVATMLTKDKAAWDKILADFPASGKEDLLTKTNYMINYFKDTWNIDIYDLQKLIADKITEISNSKSVVGTKLTQTNFSKEEDVFNKRHVCSRCFPTK